MKKLEEYKTIVFDCDGVILDSNKIKTSAFYKTALPFGKEYADKLDIYHRSHGGVSRHKKFRHFIAHILNQPFEEELYEQCLSDFSNFVVEDLTQCDETEGFRDFMEGLPTYQKHLVTSGSMESELREVFKHRNLSDYFPEGIFGSPRTKEEILEQYLRTTEDFYPALFIGDSKYDYTVARNFQMDFLFLWKYSEVDNWESFVKEKAIDYTATFSSLHG